MNITYKNTINIHADKDTTWEAITATKFAADFLPEVKKDITGMGQYVQHTHRNADRVMPAYVTSGQAIGWTAQAGNRIELPRVDTQANIQTVDIELTDRGDYTEVTIEVNYQPRLDRMFFETRRCLSGLFNIKANVLKNDLETNQETEVFAPAFA